MRAAAAAVTASAEAAAAGAVHGAVPAPAPHVFGRRRRRHDQPVAGRRPFTGVLDCARGIVAHEGIAGLWKGSVPSILKAGPNSAIIYMVSHSDDNGEGGGWLGGGQCSAVQCHAQNFSAVLNDAVTPLSHDCMLPCACVRLRMCVQVYEYTIRWLNRNFDGHFCSLNPAADPSKQSTHKFNP
jgi:hypothetical protein